MSLWDLTSYGTNNIPASLLLVTAGTWILYQVANLVRNLYFHPLSHIPGPKLAAATYLPEFYYDVVRSGRYTKCIKQMHEKYGAT